jgi:hypothetical protein
MKINIVITSIFMLLYSCKEQPEPPKVIYEKGTPQATQIAVDTTSFKVADLPILMEGTKYMIFPVGDIRVFDSERASYGSSKTSHESYAISNYNRFEITGYFDNLKFQHVDSLNSKFLTDKKIQIQTATYLDQIALKTKKQLFIYTLVDADTNNDGKINQKDIKSIYISKANGSSFTKLSEEFHELIDWNIIEVQNKLYFRSIEDINKNGAFDKEDKVHYHVVHLLEREWKAIKYDPF